MSRDIGTGQADPRDLIESHGKDATKTKSFYDGSNRLSFYVVALRDAANGARCLVTKYTYVGATSRVDLSREYFGVWSSAWDTTEDTPS